METRKLLFAAAALLGAAAVVAQVESPGDMDADSSVERSTAPREGATGAAGPEAGAERDAAFERSASTGAREGMGERPAAEDIRPGTERGDEKRETDTPSRPQSPY